ncbi:MAG TPA: DUF1853 family protein [Paraburkholderia sp.]|uniref:DUF1853 family protein n=1 Tax=Paraburkholderia sp. TaxID=1926495 RepID=UPI002BFDC73F|nr:DUF1853 family protein [Paraburkholderia sp.]HTR05733.1 DUF1853 family protein [Paraburkholderia sp.]
MNAARPAGACGATGDAGTDGPLLATETTVRESAPATSGFNDAFDTLADPAVRDLAWLLFSADLLRAQPPLAPLAQWWTNAQEAHAAHDWLVQLDHDPVHLHEALAAAPTNRLGRYAEILLGWFLANGPAARLVAQNVALRHAGRTLGECDFLVRVRTGECLHWELAVKCYLHVGSPDGQRASLAEYVGPNLRDRFDLKLAHLRDHQLRLTTREEFASLGYGGPWLAQMFVKGWLFYRAGEAASARVEDAPELAADHGRGWWVTRSDWPAFARQQAAGGWSVLPRLAWLAPRRLAGGATPGDQGEDIAADRSAPSGVVAHATNSDPPASASTAQVASDNDRAQPANFAASTALAAPADPEAILAALTRPQDPVLLAAFTRDGAGAWREQSRGFIVPDDWPARAVAFAHQ